jgi:hypothetical protein
LIGIASSAKKRKQNRYARNDAQDDLNPETDPTHKAEGTAQAFEIKRPR